MLSAVAFLAILGASDADAFGRRGPAVIASPYYGNPYYGGFPYPYYGGFANPYYGGMGYAYNPYVAPLPAYGILPPPLATYQMLYGASYDPFYHGVRRAADDYSLRSDALDYVPRKRSSLYPAIPFGTQPPDREGADPTRARFEITVPAASAVVWFDGVKMTQTGLVRVFVTPALAEGKEYTSTIKAQWTAEDGATITRERAFDFKAGGSIQFRFVEN